MVKTISMDDFVENNKTENLNVIDVREAHEYEAGHIPGAVNMALSEFEENYPELSKGKEYLLVCRSDARSGRATEFLTEQGYDATNVEGGMLQWPGEVEKSKN